MIKSFLFALIVVLIASFDVKTQSIQSIDTSSVEIRLPSKDQITSYQQDPDFNYDKEIQQSEPWIFTFLNWIGRILNKIFGNKYGSGAWDIFLLIIFVIALGLLLNAMFNGNIRTAFSGQSATKKININAGTENINELDLDSFLNEALNNKDYKLAARFLYLKTLKMLDDKNVITWSPNKTNQEYLNEIADSSVKKSFNTLTLYHDYAEYGDFEIGDLGYQNMNHSFKSILNSINSGSS